MEVYTLRWGRFERCVTTCEHCVLLQIVIIKVLLYFSSTSTEVSMKFVMLFFCVTVDDVCFLVFLDRVICKRATKWIHFTPS